MIDTENRAVNSDKTQTQRPLWTCPDCGHQLVTRNLWHSCGNYQIDDHFAGCDPVVRALFDAIVTFAQSCGPVTVYAQKTRIVFMVRVRFGGVITRKRSLRLALWLRRRAAHRCLQRIEQYGPHSFGHAFCLRSLADFDDDLRDLVREAYRVGKQEHLAHGELT